MNRDEFIKAFERCLEDTSLEFFFDILWAHTRDELIAEKKWLEDIGFKFDFDIQKHPNVNAEDAFVFVGDNDRLFFHGREAPFSLKSVETVKWRRCKDDRLTDSIIIDFGFGSFQMALNEVSHASQYAFQCWRPYMKPIFYPQFSVYSLPDVFLEASEALARSAEEFETIEFGEYPYYEDGGKRPISWLVLERGEERALLLAKDVLDVKPMYEMTGWFCRDRCAVTDVWADSDLRQWLNRVFLSEAFSDGERARIAACPGGTGDLVFLLSESELEECIPAFPVFGKDRKAALTPYAKTKEPASVVAGKCAWWIRSHQVNDYGEDIYPEVCDPSGYDSNMTIDRIAHSRHGVRPAIWIMTGLAEDC